MMARLPDASALGARPIPEAQRSIISLRDPTAEAQAAREGGAEMARVGAQVSGLGDQLLAPEGRRRAEIRELEEKTKEAVSRINEAKILNEASSEINRLASDLERDPDWQTSSGRFAAGAKKIAEGHAKRFAAAGPYFDPLAQQRFMVNIGKDVEGKRLGLSEKVFGKASVEAQAVIDQTIETAAQDRIRTDDAGRLEVDKRVASTISKMQGAGFLDPKKAGDEFRRYRQRTAEAQVLADEDAFGPAEVVDRLRDLKQYPDLDTTKRLTILERLDRRASSEADRMERRAEAQLRKQGDEAARELNAMAADGTLTRSEVDKRRPMLSPSEHKAFLKALEPDADKLTDDPAEVLRLEPMLDRPDVGVELDRAFSRGSLKIETYRSMRERHRSYRADDVPFSPRRAGRDLLTVSLDPGQLGSESMIRQPLAIAQAEALVDFDAWVETSPKATRAEAVEKAREIRDRYQNVAFDRMKIALPRPYGFAGSKEQVTTDAIAGAKQRVLADLDAGRLSQEAVARELQRLDDWERALARAPAKPAGGPK